MSEGLRLTEARIKVFEGIDSNEQRVAATRQGIWKRLIRGDSGGHKIGLRLTRLQDFFKSFSGTQCTLQQMI
jgi:hypothetical protein